MATRSRSKSSSHHLNPVDHSKPTTAALGPTHQIPRDNGTIKFDYTVRDEDGGTLKASNSFELGAVGDAPFLHGTR